MKRVVVLSIIKLTEIMIMVNGIMLIGSMLSVAMLGVTAPKKGILYFIGGISSDGEAIKLVHEFKTLLCFSATILRMP